ncbi:hypothetical protein [Deinococcus peraridilitoris]|uniref:Heme exporter protein D n=1 Tax=Deinococcus peraridilitoris (strain DSM 19664 / LMG 22246 / CIP 109416 / KR-200) TaxID=937777 RepID=K9ZXI1_DEIPD|nr:hypothetical protein [Deinococcus peraridilitoris]AFZ66373.1 hypothetical protein Deipe_0798 [Deinococcus peraridilitoris DSM 19664]
MDNFAPFVLWVYGTTAVVLVGYLGYLYTGLRREGRDKAGDGES